MRDTNRFVYWIRRLSEIAMIGWLGLLLLVDLLVAVSTEGVYGLALLPGMIGLVAVLVRRRFRVHSMLMLLAASSAVSAVVMEVDSQGYPGTAETGSLLILTIGVVRWLEPLRGAVVQAILGVVVLEFAAWRAGGEEALAFGFLLFVAWACAVAIGAYLRFQQVRREDAVHAVRRAERLELARELHDLVAHHITGIVVQAQAARTVAAQRPEAVLPALDVIATAGADALTSMRRLVSVLRAEDTAERTPGSTVADLRLLVERFSAGGPEVICSIGQGIGDGTPPPEVMITLHRVLQEALTNVRRHASGARWVEVDLRLDGRLVRLRVRNQGSAADPRVARLGGGFGLVGMAERVEALGGRLLAGPTPDGAWQVLAECPAHDLSRQ